MQFQDLHPLLQQQLKDNAIDALTLSPPTIQLLEVVNKSYQMHDVKQQQLQATVDLRTEQLIGSTSRAYSFLDSLHMGFVMCDVNAEVVLTNTSVRQIFASKLPANPGPNTVDLQWNLQTIAALFAPELDLKTLIESCLKTAQSIEQKEINFGTRVVHLFIAPMINTVNDGEQQLIGAVLLIEDITEQVVLERSKDEFLSIASHELRTPLTAIRGNASLIRTYYGNKIQDLNVSEMIDDIHESAIRLIEIVNDFLDASSLEQGKITMNPESFALHDVVDDVVRELEHLCESKHIALSGDESVATIPNVHADKQRIKQVIYNLVGNAVKFTEQGSIIISAHADDNFVYTLVTDTGTGMSPENQRLLFRKFQQAGSSLLTRDSSKGTGLGLYISKLIVERSGGTIGLQHSELGKGSTFEFSLPIAK
jgi:signal transduction histidine kinase